MVLRCAVCFELYTEETALVFSDCAHSFCRSCWQTWLLQQERQGVEVATCPTCRRSVPEEVCYKILERNYQPQQHVVARNNELEDDLTRVALEGMGCKQCPNPSCQAWIVKEEGCDIMQCICGQRFCWRCADGGIDAGAGCEHMNGHHHFFNNNSRQIVPRGTMSTAAGPEELEDLATYLRPRQGPRDTTYIRREREYHQSRQEEMIWQSQRRSKPYHGAMNSFVWRLRLSRDKEDRRKYHRFGPGEELDALARQAMEAALCEPTSDYHREYQDWVERRQEATVMHYQQHGMFRYRRLLFVEDIFPDLGERNLDQHDPHAGAGDANRAPTKQYIGLGEQLDELARQAFQALTIVTRSSKTAEQRPEKRQKVADSDRPITPSLDLGEFECENVDDESEYDYMDCDD